MFRTTILATLLSGSSLWAADYTTIAPVSAVTVYPVGASVMREISVDLPAGRHRVLLPLPRGIGNDPLRISPRGELTLGAQEILRNHVVDPEQLYTLDQLAAFAQIKKLREDVAAQEGRLAKAAGRLAGAEAEENFASSITASALERLNVEALSEVSSLVRTRVSGAKERQQSARETIRTEQLALDAVQKLLAQAERDFARLSPPEGQIDMLAVTVELEVADTVRMVLERLSSDARWRADYDLRLTRDTGKVEVARKMVVQQFSGELWSDVDLTLSTANPFTDLEPSPAFPNRARLINPQIQTKSYDLEFSSRAAIAPQADAAVSEEAIIVETADVVIDGLSVTYEYPQPVTLSPENGALILSLDTFTLDAEIFNRASPRQDETAFLMARVTNSRDEPLLPGEASIYRDGAFVGRVGFEQIAAGQEAELSFGSLEGIRLEYRLLNNDTGDRGLIATSATRNQSFEFTVENLTSEAENVETLFALPYAEEEDLRLRVAARPAPNGQDFDKMRGVGMWSLDLSPGQKKTVRVDVELSWPEGQQLIWQP